MNHAEEDLCAPERSIGWVGSDDCWVGELPKGQSRRSISCSQTSIGRQCYNTARTLHHQPTL